MTEDVSGVDLVFAVTMPPLLRTWQGRVLRSRLCIQKSCSPRTTGVCVDLSCYAELVPDT